MVIRNRLENAPPVLGFLGGLQGLWRCNIGIAESRIRRTYRCSCNALLGDFLSRKLALLVRHIYAQNEVEVKASAERVWPV